MEQFAVFCIILMCVYALIELVSVGRAFIKKRRTASVYGIVTVPEDKFDAAEWESINLAFEISEHQTHWDEMRQRELEKYSDEYQAARKRVVDWHMKQ